MVKIYNSLTKEEMEACRQQSEVSNAKYFEYVRDLINGKATLYPGETARIALTKPGTDLLSVIWRCSDAPLVPASASFKSSNPPVATVSSAGKITAVGIGSATITVSHKGMESSVDVNVIGSTKMCLNNEKAVLCEL